MMAGDATNDRDSGHDTAGGGSPHCHHGCGHGGHHHHGDPDRQSTAFRVAIALNASFVVAQFAYGVAANSTALMADAGHNLADVLGLALALAASILAKRAPSPRFTYGLRSSSILAALANAMLLLLTCGGIAWEAARRMLAPPPVSGLTVTLVAAAGIAVNGISAWLFLRGSKGDINVRGAFLHMAGDTALSLGVVVAGLVIMKTGWYWIDPVVSLGIVILILAGTWGLLRESVRLILSAVPAGIDREAVSAFLRSRPGVTDVHDLHIWGMSTTENALTVHLVMPAGYPGDAVLDEIAEGLRTRFSIAHSTLQVEMGTTEHACALQPAA